MDVLECPIQPYAWGSRTAIAAMQGREPSGEPEAELWIGAHPIAPAHLIRDGDRVGLDEVIASDPVRELGIATAERWRGQLPFLLKVLAAAEPLSLQAHPSLEQAREGFAAEQAAAVPLDAAHRLFRDANHKPELICAVTEFSALCGFRPVPASIDLLGALGAPELGPELVTILRADPDAIGLRRAVIKALGTSADRAAAALSGLRSSAARGVPGFESECRWLVRLIDRWPRDPAVFVAALLDLVVLEPGQALFLGAGNLHCYLGGVGVEVMANSDNVIRGGLTSKPVDIDTLVEVVVTESSHAPVQTPRAPVWTYRSPVPEFALTRLRLDDGTEALPTGMALAVAVEGDVRVDLDGTEHRLGSGQGAWFPATDGPRHARGTGTLFVATAGM